jgi:hypothetical protein
VSGPVPPPPALPPGWEAVPRIDRATGQPMLLVRVRPYRRRVLTVFGVLASVTMWTWFLWATPRTPADQRPFGWFLGFVAVGATVVTVHGALWQPGWLLRPGRLEGGTIWVATGGWHGRPTPVAELEFRADDNDGTAYRCLDALPPGGRGGIEIFQEREDAAVAAPFAGWLATVAGIPIRPAVKPYPGRRL